MPHRIKNNKIELLVDLPNENYAGARFDWMGKIAEVKFQDLIFTGLEELNANNPHQLGRGLYNEFGIDSPLGFGEAEIGDWFHKIGVGLLKKDSDQYSFARPYEIKPCEFLIHSEAEKIQFECKSEFVNGYAYVLRKEIELLENGFVIKYFLKNTGEKEIITNEYNHNFLAFGNERIGKDYLLTFPFKLKKQQIGESVNPKGVVQIGAEDIGFVDNPSEAFFFSNLSGGKNVPAYWQLENQKMNLGIREIGDFETAKINLWGCRHVMSPELFFEINLKPTQMCTWSRRYEFFKC